MPMSPSKWQARTRVRSFEQRAKAKARLLGTPEKQPARPIQWPDMSSLANAFNNLNNVITTATPSITALGQQIIGAFNVPPPVVGQATRPQYTYAPTYMRGDLYNTIPITNGPYLPANQYFVANNTQINYTFDSSQFYPYQEYAYNPYSSYRPQYVLRNDYMAIGAGTETAWTQWQNGTGSITYADPYIAQRVWSDWCERLTPRQRRELDEQNAEHCRQQEEARRKAAAEREEAQRRAMEMFISTLDHEERATFEKEKCVYVRGNRGRRYRIRCQGQAGNVDWLDEHGTVRGRFCIHPREWVPDPDAWVVQRLLLRHDEDEFVRVANVTGERPPALPAAA